MSKSIDSERIFYPSDDSLLPGPWSTGTEGSRAPGRGAAVLASPVPHNSDIDIFDGGTPANETIASFSPSRDATSVGSLWELSDPLGLAKLPGNVLLAGLIAAYTKNGIFACLFILRSVSAAPKPWYYALYVPGSGWGVFSTWDLCAAHGAIGGSRARHKKYRNIQEALAHINVHYPIPTSTQILLDFWYPFEGEATPAHPGVLLQPPVVLSPGTITTYAQPGDGNGAAASSSAASSSTATDNGAPLRHRRLHRRP